MLTKEEKRVKIKKVEKKEKVMKTKLSFPLGGNPGKSKGYRYRTRRNDRTRDCRV